MKINIEEMKEIGRTLPIGYYLGRKTPVMIEEGTHAYADVVKGDIHIGIGLLQIAADKISAADANKWDREALLRCLLYHEIGHLLLTPSGLGELIDYRSFYFDKSKTKKISDRKMKTLINIFEDERLECILSMFFHGVDFKAFCNLINKDAKSDTPISKFLTAIRLRQTTPAISTKIDDAIESLGEINYLKWLYGSFDYADKLQDLIWAILDEEQEEQQQQQQQQQSNENSESNKQEDSKQENSKNNESDEGENNESEKGESNENENNEGETEEDTEGNASFQIPRAIKLNDNYLSSIANAAFVKPTMRMSSELKKFASRLAKKKGNQSAGGWSGLTGRIDTKRDALDKEKVFRRASEDGERLMQSVNLTLWIDVSGSFVGSRKKINQILSAANIALKMAGSKLKINVVKMGEGASVAPSTQWEVNPAGGNCIDRTYYESWQKTRQKSMRNIDIVVFDGECCYAADRLKCGIDFDSLIDALKEEVLTARKIWDSRDCWIVSDNRNKRFFDAALTKARITYISSDYANHLEGTLLNVLNRIL